jgi:hypothetical protein
MTENNAKTDEFYDAWNASPLSNRSALNAIVDELDPETLKKLTEKLRNPELDWEVKLSAIVTIPGDGDDTTKNDIIDALAKTIHQMGIRQWLEQVSIDTFEVLYEAEDDEDDNLCEDCGWSVVEGDECACTKEDSCVCNDCGCNDCGCDDYECHCNETCFFGG